VVDEGPVRGQVWEYIAGSHQFRVLIVSNDEYNDRPDIEALGLLVPRRTPDPAMGDLAPIMAAGDPLPGSAALVAHSMRLLRSGLRRNLGFVSNATLSAVEDGLRDFLVLP